jgi:hypothetical protein
MDGGGNAMNRSLLGRIAPFLFAFYALSLLAFFAYALLTFSATGYLPTMRWEFALKHGFVLFMDYLIPVHAAAVAVAASLAGTGRAARAPAAPAESFSRLVASTLVVFLLLTAAYTVLFEGLYPAALRRLSDMQYQSSLARQYANQADAAVKQGDYRTGLDRLTRYLAVDPSNKEMAAQKLALETLAAKQAAPGPAPTAAGQAEGNQAMGAQGLVQKAQYYFDRQDWFSAHYYAQQAAALDPRRTDALRLASQAWDKLNGQPGEGGDAGAKLFQQKKDAYALLAGGDAMAAYYRFVALAAQNPKDADIKTYLDEAGKKVAQESFFLDDAKQVETLPGTQGILFLNGLTGGATEAVSIGKMVEMPGGDDYFYDVEAIHYDASGNVLWHMSAPYGRREGDSLLMHCIDRTDPSVQFLPLYVQGSRPPAERATLTLQPTVEELRALSTSRNALAVMSLDELWRMRGRLDAFGLSADTLMVNMAMKMLMPFAFLVLSIFSLTLGWAFRARTARMSPFAVILMPLVPIVLAMLSLLYVHAHRVVFAFAVLAFGFTTALVVLGALELVLLAAALVTMAGQSAR